MRTASLVASLYLVIALVAACISRTVCPGSCPEGGSALLQLACTPTEPVSVTASGPCAVSDDAGAPYVNLWHAPSGSTVLVIGSPAPGVCHVLLTFASGFTYATDMNFDWQNVSPTGCCPPFVGPTSSTNGYAVDNPPGTCAPVDAGADDASRDASADASAGD